MDRESRDSGLRKERNKQCESREIKQVMKLEVRNKRNKQRKYRKKTMSKKMRNY